MPEHVQASVAAPDSVIMQPTTLCNLDCRYCYLADRKNDRRMTPAVARAVAASVRRWLSSRAVEVIWHGGEPLAAGRDHLGLLFDQFADVEVSHSIQTNAVLIDEAWSAWLAERHVRVGVSIDGAECDNEARVDFAGRPAFRRIERGIRRLVADGHPVSVIAVVSDPTPERARRLYQAVAELGARWLGVNIEECEGVNDRSNEHDLGQVRAFWSALLEEWIADDRVGLRDIDRVLAYAGRVFNGHAAGGRTPVIDPLPTVGWNGNVTLISPELAGFRSDRFGDFACGNVLAHDLDTLVERGSRCAWVAEYRRGLAQCHSTCPYFDFCGGGHPANRYFELGRFDVAETNYCRNGKIALVEGVLDAARRPDRHFEHGVAE
ncbi:cyclophane-forming radical SAM peptide maturase AmcB [Saccharopolyspora rosea]|uniref:Cyclophane-forming radical SAM peptide maturase AmcB n=1 Tax=Saccharopolyspora rosea TaxID=524884 RepID=A0ABW3FXM9_9PSEU|nr:cyclophane-forming radical SAM peptide maturase AmcB [Saccharopolyspora rosea]